MRYLYLIALFLLAGACSHEYESDTLDLSFYQWNLWPDQDAVSVADSLYSSSQNASNFPANAPSCGWEVLHRGNGKLVRIPAMVKDTEVAWFHTRFTLPELWANRDIVLNFKGAGPKVEVYLNENLIGFHQGDETSFELDVSESIYYVRDNHLAIRISDAEGGLGGISGGVKVKSIVPDGMEPESTE